MTRKKIQKLTRILQTRVTQAFYEKMENWLVHSNCRSISELGRAILCREKIIYYHTDDRMNEAAAQLARMRVEIKAIGNSINKITRSFNSTNLPNQKIFYALKVQSEYNKVGLKVDEVLKMINEVILPRWDLKEEVKHPPKV